MKHLIASAPTRIDLAGGTLDIWPLNLLVERALTVNVAIDLHATVVLEASSGSSAEIRSEDQDIEEVWTPPAGPPSDTRLPLVAECVKLFEPARGFRLTTRCKAPAGSGLGGSSALAISMLGGLQSFLNRPIMPPDEMVRVARDLEARVIQIPTGTQDHIAAVFGGAAAIRYGPGQPVREALPIDLDQLASRLVLAYCGASRLSADANWDMVRRAIEKDPATRSSLNAIAGIAWEMRAALKDGDFDAVGRFMEEEWNQRRRLSPKVSTELTEKAISAAIRAGALAGKVCGAGGGGCIAFICREGARTAVETALGTLASSGLAILPAKPTGVGLQLAR